MKMAKAAGAIAALAVSFAGAGAANAAVYDLTVNGGAIGGLSSYGTVTVNQNANGVGLDFTVDLADGVFFHTGGSHTSFAFDLVGAPTVTFSNISGFGSGFSTGGPSSFPNSPFTNGAQNTPFEYGLNCNCDQGNDPDVPGPLSFTINPTNGTTVLALDGHSSNGFPLIFAAADLRNTNRNGSTGAVGAVLIPGVPEPATWAMMILGMGMVGGVLRMRRRVGFAGVNA